MKVCVVSSKVCWRDPAGEWKADGGFPVQMSGISSLFDEMDLLIVGGNERPGGLAIPAKANVYTLAQPTGADFRRKLSVLARLPYYLLKISNRIAAADVVHVPLPGDIPSLGLLMGWLMRKRMIVRYCGSWAESSHTTLMNRVLKNSMRMLAGKRFVLLATGEGAEAPAPGLNWIFATALSRSELSSVHVDLERTLSNPPRLVYIGRLAREKGVPILIEALSSLKHSGFSPLPELTLIGDGDVRVQLENMVRAAGCEHLVHFAGQLTREEMQPRLLRADVCVHPSLTEGFSKAWLDAMAHGVPVLTSNVGAAAAVVGEEGVRGWLTQPGSSTELAKRLRLILTSNLNWPELRQRCRNFAEARTIEGWSERIGEICIAQWGARTKEDNAGANRSGDSPSILAARG